MSRILGPLLLTLTNLSAACEESEGLARYMEAYGGIDKVCTCVCVGGGGGGFLIVKKNFLRYLFL